MKNSEGGSFEEYFSKLVSMMDRSGVLKEDRRKELILTGFLSCGRHVYTQHIISSNL